MLYLIYQVNGCIKYMRIYCYARVSIKDQNLDKQILELTKYVDAKYIFTDKQNGKDMDRQQYQLLKKVSKVTRSILGRWIA